jgi:Fic family protein
MIESRQMARLVQKKARLDALRPLPRAVLERLNKEMAVEWTYHSNAIEGSTLTLVDTRLILETGLTIGGKSLREHLEVINHRQAIDYATALADGTESITPLHLRQLHRLVLARIDDAAAGEYRTLPVRVASAGFQPPDAWQVAPLMEEWPIGSMAWRGTGTQSSVPRVPTIAWLRSTRSWMAMGERHG